MTAVPTAEQSFAALTERHRRELHVHCYRMLASFDDADDAVQETYLRAWRAWESFDGGDMARAWMYRIATNVCLDLLRTRARQPTAAQTFAEVAWLQPYPDQLLDEYEPGADGRRRADGRLAARAHPRQPDADRRELPAPTGEREYRAFKFDVLRIEAGRIAEITTFGPDLFPAFGLPSTLKLARDVQKAGGA